MQKKLPELNLPKYIMGRVASMFIDRIRVVYLIVAAVLIFGLVTYTQLPKETVPDISLSYIYVQVPYPGAAVSDIDSMVSEPIEDRLSSVKGVEAVTSTIENGYARVIAEFEDTANMEEAEQKIRNEVASIALPEGALSPVIGVFETGEMPIFRVTVTGEYDLISLKRFAETLKSQMENVEGIRKVELRGGYDREIKIIVDPVTMQSYNLTFSQISQAIQSVNVNMPSGNVTLDHEDINIRIDERFTSIENIENIPVVASAERYIKLSDVAIVEDAYKTPTSLSRLYQFESENEATTEAVYLTVYRDSGFDIVKPSEALRQIITSAGAQHVIPSDVDLLITADQSVDVVKDLKTVVNNALGGLISVIIVLYVFIGLNEALIVSTVIPISLFIALLLMKWTNISFNTISLTGFIIALGLLVDNAIVVMENIDRLRDEGLDRITASKVGLNQVAPAVLAATLTTVGAFIPVAMTPGIIGKFLSVMPMTIIFIIGASFVISIVVTPALCSRFLSKYKKKRTVPSRKEKITASAFIFVLSLFAFSNQWHITGITIVISILFVVFYLVMAQNRPDRVEEGNLNGVAKPKFVDKYKSFIFEIIASKSKKILIILIATVVFVSSIAMIQLGYLKLELFPYEEPTTLVVSLEAPRGTTLEDTSLIVEKVEAKLFDLEGIKTFTSSIGGDNSYTASINIELQDSDERALTGDALQQSIRLMVSEIPDAQFEVKAQSSMSRVSGGSAISLGLVGDDFATLNNYAKAYFDVLKNMEGIIEPKLSSSGGNRTLIVDIDPTKAAYYGLTVSGISSEMRQRISGVHVGTYLDQNDEMDMTLYYLDSNLTTEADFEKIYFTNNSGQKIHFTDVAAIRYEDGIGRIEKEDGKMVVYVEADIASGYNSAEVNKAFAEKVKTLELPSGITQKVGGEMADLSEQIQNMIFNFGVALVMVYIILVIQFNSFLQPLMILFSVPFAIIGVVFGLIATGNNLGFYAMFGIVALVGIAVNDAIVLIDFTNYLRSEGHPLRNAVAEAVKTRFQPVMATSLTTIGGVLPLALFNASFSQLGYALIFGLMASTVLTLLIIPIMYYSIESISDHKGEIHE